MYLTFALLFTAYANSGCTLNWREKPKNLSLPETSLVKLRWNSLNTRLSETEMASHIHFYLFTKKHQHGVPLTMHTDSPEREGYEVDKPLKLITHGFNKRGLEETCVVIKDEYLKKHDVNVIILDWGRFATNLNYFVASQYPKQIGAFVATFVRKLVEEGANPERFHFIGHSLGAHLLGFVGKNLKSKKIGRITGLDPAGIGFANAPSNDRLSTQDAAFVDVIHTSAAILGLNKSIGHADFYPNGGTSAQPGCGTSLLDAEFCSHRRSWEYFAESINSEKAFVACEWPKWRAHEKGGMCTGFPVPMGNPAPSTARGDYCLSTRSYSPYALGFDGRFLRLNVLIRVFICLFGC